MVPKLGVGAGAGLSGAEDPPGVDGRSEGDLSGGGPALGARLDAAVVVPSVAASDESLRVAVTGSAWSGGLGVGIGGSPSPRDFRETTRAVMGPGPA